MPCAVGMVAQSQHFVSEKHTGRQPQVEMRAQVKVCHQRHIETRIEIGHLHKPALAFGRGISRTENRQVLNMRTDRKTEMPTAVVIVRQVLHLLLLCKDAPAPDKQQRNGYEYSLQHLLSYPLQDKIHFLLLNIL